ncbi:hypothetical protein MTR_2g064920 [Medicago truncatula]|uniref:Uncharacterized protein n=1 Tax=Medicago truncatula TaxID=3880 RepID=G7IJ70_MEDTR|nr:hypothetical protein MTR_2g064920 [Medicago truncatula]
MDNVVENEDPAKNKSVLMEGVKKSASHALTIDKSNDIAMMLWCLWCRRSADQTHNNNTKPAATNSSVTANVDAAMFEEQRCFGIGMCIRNYRDHFSKAATFWQDGSPLHKKGEQ